MAWRQSRKGKWKYRGACQHRCSHTGVEQSNRTNRGELITLLCILPSPPYIPISLSSLHGKALIYLFRSFPPYLSVCTHTSSSQIFVTFSLTSYRGRAVASWKRIKEQERGDRDRGKKGKRGGIIKYAPRGNSYLSLESIIIHAFLS